MSTAASRTPETIQKNIQRLISRCQDLVDTKQTEVCVKVPIWKLKTVSIRTCFGALTMPIRMLQSYNLINTTSSTGLHEPSLVFLGLT